MAEPPKKFTFGFSKVVKKSNLVAPPAVSKEKKDNVQFIECMEANAIKLKEGEENEKTDAPLVIPIIGPRKSSTLSNGRSIAEIAEDFSDVGDGFPIIKQEVVEINLPTNSLDALAAREILQEGADTLKETPVSTLHTLPTSESEEREKLRKESTLEDYENIPVNQFGLAMLRGMGWKPDEGIGKNKQLVAVTAPQLRPKGMGLGADKMLLAVAVEKTAAKKNEEELKMVKGAYVKVAAGMHKNQYAQVEGFSDDSGRVVLKMAIGGHVLSVNEASVILVSRTEYNKNSKVLNAAKFDEFKKNEETASKEEKGKSHSQSSRVPKRSGASIDYPPKQERSSSPVPVLKKEKHSPRSSSRSPERTSRRNYSSKYYKDKSQSPCKSQHSRNNEKKSNSSSVKRSSSSSTDRGASYSSPVRGKRSRDYSPSKDNSCDTRKHFYDSDSDSQKKHKKKKKEHKKRRRTRSRSVSEEYSRRRSRSPKAKRKEKRRGRSRSRSFCSLKR